MTFADAVNQCHALSAFLRRGLEALLPVDRGRVTTANPRCLVGSVNLDEALRDKDPQGHRWDYGLGVARGRPGQQEVVWLEVHPSTAGDVGTVLAKKAWLDSWLRQHAPALAAMPSRAIWVSSGRVSLTPGSTSRRQLASRGILFTGRRCRL